jgi:hypothetical protein
MAFHITYQSFLLTVFIPYETLSVFIISFGKNKHFYTKQPVLLLISIINLHFNGCTLLIINGQPEIFSKRGLAVSSNTDFSFNEHVGGRVSDTSSQNIQNYLLHCNQMPFKQK